jgi:hypothetical protein
MKKSQITLFIAVGILIIIILALAFSLRARFVQDAGLPNDVRVLQEQIASCLQEKSNTVIRMIGRNAGNLEPGESITVNGQQITFYAQKSLQQMQQEINMHLNNENCNPESRLNIVRQKTSASSKINRDNVFITIQYPLTVKSLQSVYNLNEPYEIVVPVRLGMINELIPQILQEPLCISCISDLSVQNNIGIDLFSYNNTLIVRLTDNLYQFILAK